MARSVKGKAIAPIPSLVHFSALLRRLLPNSVDSYFLVPWASSADVFRFTLTSAEVKDLLITCLDSD